MMYKASCVGGFLMGKIGKKHRTSTGGKIAEGAVAGAVTSAMLLLIWSLLIEKGVVTLQSVKTAVIAINLISAFVCGAAAGVGQGEKRAVRAIVACAAYTLIVLIFAFIVNEGSINTNAALRIFACGLGGTLCAIPLVLCKSNKKLRKRTKRKNSYNKR